MTDQELQFLLQRMGGGNIPPPQFNPGNSYPQFRQGIDPFISGTPLEPNQLSPSPNIFRGSTDPNVFLDDSSFPAARPIIIGTGQVPPGGDQRAWAGTNNANVFPYNNIEDQYYTQYNKDLMNRFGTRLAREGLLGGEAVNPNFPQFRPGGEFGEQDLPGTSSPTFENFPTNPYPGPENETYDLPSNYDPGPTYGSVLNDYFGDQGFNIPFGGPDVSTVPLTGETPYNPYGGTMNDPSPDVPANLWAGGEGPSLYPQTPTTPAGIYDPNPYVQPTNISAGDFPVGGTFPWPYQINEFPGEDTSTSAPGISYRDEGNQPINQPAGPVNQPYPYFVNQFPGTSATGLIGTGGGGPGYGYPPSTPDIITYPDQGGINAKVPGVAQSATDAAARRNMEQFPSPPGFHPGQTIRDAAGNLVDFSGRVISSAGNEARALWNNILNDPRNTDPNYLAGMGYNEMGDVGSGFMIPGGVSGPSVGPNDVGTYGAINAGSYFHGGASAGMQHGATSVAGAYSGLGAGAIANLRGTSWGSALDANALRRLMKGYYTSPQSYAALSAATPYRGAPPASFDVFHQSQVQLGDILRANPSFVQNAMARPGPGEAPHFGTRGGSREAILPK